MPSETMNSSTERRRFARYSLYLPFELQLEQKAWAHTLTLNLGLGGVKIRSKVLSNLPVSSFALHLETEGNIFGKVKKIWHKKMEEFPVLYVLGFEFLEFQKDGKEKLESFLNKVSLYWKNP
jgi:hypothetical protein